MSNYHEATDDLMCNADVVSEWLGQFGSLECDRTAALIRVLTAGSARALLRAQHELVQLFAVDHAEQIGELALRMDSLPAERAQDLRDELAGYRT